MNLKGKKVLVTGAAFIGSHLVEELRELEVSKIRVANKSDKHKKYFLENDVEFLERDLRDLSKAKASVSGMDVVFHLAADHGGRGYVDSFAGKTASNFLLDGSVFKACLEKDIEKVIFASSGCVYPVTMQSHVEDEIFLKEEDVEPPYEADNVYGWAKLMGEMVLDAYYKDFGMKSAVGRFFTVFGERAEESHAVVGTIAKAFVELDPFIVWGSGKQIRNWTYVKDIVSGLILLAEKVEDASSINLGTMERVTVDEMVNLVLENIGFHPGKLVFESNMPTGPLNRVADNSLAKKILNWEPKYSFEMGLGKTVEWYLKTKNEELVKNNLEDLLMGKVHV